MTEYPDLKALEKTSLNSPEELVITIFHARAEALIDGRSFILKLKSLTITNFKKVGRYNRQTLKILLKFESCIE